MSKLKVLDLFSGIGGFSLGLERTGGFETVAFCEIEEFPRKILAKHWPGVPCFPDVRKLRAEDVEPVDVICGGFPCQDISIANSGAQSGIDGARSGLWAEFFRQICEHRPSWAVIENTPALRRRGLRRILVELSEIGYDAEWHCIPATAVDAPSSRDRVWIISYPAGVRNGLPQEQVLSRRHFVEHVHRWEALPGVCPVADGLPYQVDRLKALGNSVVPRILEIIGHAILEAEADWGLAA
ncbi:MAG: DNA cytosine methyltransferase [Pseudomonadota bacterium]